MDIKQVYEDGNLAKYLIKGVSPAFMNSIRRAVLSNVPCLAIDEVTFYANDSPIFDEMLANRLGLLPIKTDVTSYKEGDEVKLILEKEGKGPVTSKDIKCTDPKIEIADKKIYITNLPENGKIRLEMKAVMKTGKTHAKHQPAIIAYNEIIKINNDKSHKNADAIIKEAPKNSLELKAGKLFLADPYNTKLHDQPLNILEKYDVDYEFVKNEFVLTIETTGQLTNNELVTKALEALKLKTSEFSKEFAKI